MEFHPDLGFVENGVDLTNVELYKSTNLPFGQATILPPFTYQSKIFSDLEDEKLWTRNWIAIGFTHEIPNAGDLLPFTVGHHGIHVQRQQDGSLIGRFNKAQHGGCRAVPLQCQTGKKTKCSFTSCGYSRDRNVIRVEEIGENTPTMHQYLGLIPERLLPVKVETWNQIIFVNLDNECESLSSSIKELPKNITSLLSKDFTLHNSEWFECLSNWKFAGRAFFDASNVNYSSSGHDNKKTSDYYLATDLTVPSIKVGTDDHSGNTQLCWLFPNLLLVIHPTYVVSVVLQPTSMRECLLRACILRNENQQKDNNPSHLPAEWQAYLQSIQTNAQSMQKKADELTAPGAPELTQDMIPVETNFAAYNFHRYITRKIEIEHDYYWNAPLYSNNLRA